MTRAAPARLLGLADRGHLGPGARADIAVYRPGPDLAAMFRHAARVFKDGDCVVREGVLTHYRFGRALTRRARARRGDRPAPRRILRRAATASTPTVRACRARALPREPFETVACPS